MAGPVAEPAARDYEAGRLAHRMPARPAMRATAP